MTLIAILLLLPGAFLVLAEHPSNVPRATAGPSQISEFWDKPVHFVETGLAAGTNWSVNLSGTVGFSLTTTITFSEIPGVYPFTVVPVVGYTAVPTSGNVTVGDCGATVYITFSPAPTYSILFNETGLPAGTTWWANLSGTNTSATTSTIAFPVMNGTYSFTTPGLVSGPPGEQFLTSVTGGAVVVNGANVTVVVPFVTQYYLTMGMNPAGTGTVTPVSGWYPAGTTVELSATPIAGYFFLNWNGTGSGNYTGINSTTNITMNGPISQNATFGLGYAVDFEELGLLDGVTWSVTFNGVTQSAFFVFLDFSAPNGTYPYTVAPIPGYHADSYHGNVTVAGSDVTVVIHWVRLTYNVSFVETGLPSGTTWSVTFNGSTLSSTLSTILFLQGNGSFPFSVGSVVGYVANVTAGSVIVNGADVTVDIGWTLAGPVARAHAIKFTETGLPLGTSWSVTLNGTNSASLGTTTSTVVFSGLSDGTYHYWAPDVGKYRAANGTGAVLVAGANVTVTLTFADLSPADIPSSGIQISVFELVIFGLIAIAGIIGAYLVYRRV